MSKTLLFNEDCVKSINKLPNEIIDLTITSPPYNVDLGNNKYNKNAYNLYNDNQPHHKYIEWLKGIFQQIYKKTKKGGRCAINIGDGKNGNIPTHSDIIQFMCNKIGWIPMATIIWNKNQTSPRTAWGSFQSCSSPSFPTPFEYVLIFCKETKKIQYKGETDIEKQEFIDWSLALWSFPGETKAKKLGHPAPFPEELPKRLIKLFSYKEAVIFDPFMGIGTTGLVAQKLNRKFIGCEISEEYFNIGKERILKTT